MKHYQQKGINFMRNCCSFKGYKLRLKIKQIALLELVSIFSCNLKYQMGIVKRNTNYEEEIVVLTVVPTFSLK